MKLNNFDTPPTYFFFLLKVSFERLAEGTVELQNAALLGNTWDLKNFVCF
jgi:hypothetical protein